MWVGRSKCEKQSVLDRGCLQRGQDWNLGLQIPSTLRRSNIVVRFRVARAAAAVQRESQHRQGGRTDLHMPSECGGPIPASE